jgi:glutamine synthetase
MNKVLMNPNPLISFLKKPSEEITKADLIRFVEENDIKMINFRYTAWDGRLKTLNYIIGSKEHLDLILTAGERVDGSSLFPFVEPGTSDLYVIPRYKTAFFNPFSEIPAIDILCGFYNSNGEPFEGAPEHILRKAHRAFKETTGFEFEAMGELEYYIISKDDGLFHAENEHAYHESSPFSKWMDFRTEAMLLIAEAGGTIKYGHSEVGNFTQDDYVFEQNEIEFLPTNVEDAADQLIKAKWIIRTLAMKYGVEVTFAPKITVGKAGSGLHIHTRIMKNGKNMMINNGKLTDVAKKAIAGYIELAASLTAFGNLNPTSYLRLVPNHEAPTNICWGDRNRSVLVRVPLGWNKPVNMTGDANPLENTEKVDFSNKQTVELRSPDGSADIYQLLAGITVAARHGFETKHALEIAEKTYVDINIFDDKFKDKLNSLKHLPSSCYESAVNLEAQKEIYLQKGVFSEGVLDWRIKELKAFDDKNLRSEISDNKRKIKELVKRFFHCG